MYDQDKTIFKYTCLCISFNHLNTIISFIYLFIVIYYIGIGAKKMA